MMAENISDLEKQGSDLNSALAELKINKEVQQKNDKQMVCFCFVCVVHCNYFVNIIFRSEN